MRKLFLLLPVILAGCAVGPDHVVPIAPAPAAGAFVTAAPATDPGAPLPDDWWRLYDDPALDRLITRALTGNTDLRVAIANLARARAVVGEARAGRLPTTGLSAQAGYGNGGQLSGFQSGTEQLGANGGLAMSWEADLFGRVHRTIEAARADAAAIEAARDMVRVTVVAETARAYVAACTLAGSAAIARELLTIAETDLRLVSLRERAGLAGRLDVERSAAAVANARAAIPSLDDQRRIALFELAALIGVTPTEAPGEAIACTRPPELRGALPVGDGAALLRRRPDIREAERMLAADTARIGVATADLYPRISFGGSAGYGQNDKGPSGFSFSVGPLLSWSFPNIAVARNRIRQAEAQGEASLARFDGVVLTALKEVEQALSGYAASAERDAALADAVARADNAHRLALARYRAGSISQLDVIVAQRTLLDARAASADSVRRLADARILLFKALGGGWAASEG